jgi:TolB-like protein/Flp pilus assembly protein TadD
MSFFSELKRRNVIRVSIAYVVVSWLVSQVAEFAIETFGAPDWVLKIFVVFLMLGFPVVAVFAWVFEITPEGIKRERDIDRSRSITRNTGRKLDYTIIILLVLALGYLVFNEVRGPAMEAPATAAQTEIQASPPVAADVDVVPADPSIAVLPFSDLSPDQDQGYFSDGISEELLNVLVKVQGLKVASRTSSFIYKDSKQSLAEIAGELKVDHILEGSVRKAGNRVRITAQLIDANTDRHLWSETFDRELVDIFAIQDEIANAIVNALSTELGILQDTPAISVVTVTKNLDAYELYLKARGLFLAREHLEDSISLFEQAVEIDPDFARAWEGLAAVYSVAESWGFAGRDWDSLGTQAAERALELNPVLSMPWAVIGQIATNNGDSITGMVNLDRAISLDPGNATFYLWRGIQYSELGFQNESVADIEQCLEIDPAYENCRRHLAFTFLILDDNERAMALFQQGYERGFRGGEALFVPRFVSLGERLLAATILYSPDEFDSTFPAKAILDAMEYPDRDNSRGLEKMLNWMDQHEYHPAYLASAMSTFKAYHLVAWSASFNRWVWLKEHTGFRKSEYFKPVMDEFGAPAYWREKGFPPGCRALAGDDFECD